MPTLTDFSATALDGSEHHLAQHAGEVVLVVNTASKCGFAPQFAGLEKLHRQFADQGFSVLGFPSNQFKQELADADQVADYCQKNYGVTFPMFSKVGVIGATATPLYQFLGDRSRNGVTDSKPDWNFCKYLIDESGHVMAFYPSAVNPLDPALLQQIVGARASSANAQ